MTRPSCSDGTEREDWRVQPKKETQSTYMEREQRLLKFSRGNHIGNTSLKTVSLPQNVTEVINEMLVADKGLLGEIKK